MKIPQDYFDITYQGGNIDEGFYSSDEYDYFMAENLHKLLDIKPISKCSLNLFSIRIADVINFDDVTNNK